MLLSVGCWNGLSLSESPLQTPLSQHSGWWWGHSAWVWTGSIILRVSEGSSGRQMIQKVELDSRCPSAAGGLFIIHDSVYRHLLAADSWQRISAAMSLSFKKFDVWGQKQLEMLRDREYTVSAEIWFSTTGTKMKLCNRGIYFVVCVCKI